MEEVDLPRQKKVVQKTNSAHNSMCHRPSNVCSVFMTTPLGQTHCDT